jgi:prepilin-type N-terminal cleavage/methylation domain-containing protein
MRASRGYSLAECMVVVAIIGLMAAVAIPPFAEYRRRRGLRSAASQMRVIFALARSQAIARGHNVAVKFRQIGGRWHYALFEDGNSNGVSNADIVRGTDPLVQPYQVVLQGAAVSRIGLPLRAIKDPTGSGSIPPSASPVRFNRSTLCSFSPLGESTSGSIFLTDGVGTAAVVIVYGPTARLRLMVYDEGRWKGRQ